MTSLYDLVVVTPTRILQTEVTILEKTEAWAKENGVSMADLVGARIYEDMLPMSMQIVITAMFARKAVELLSGKDVEPKEYRNYDLEGCRSLLSETLSLLAEVKPESVNGKETEVIEFGVGKRTAKAPAAEYVHRFLIPTIYFHLTTMYDILRMKGVPIGKLDYLTHYLDTLELSPPL